MRCILSTTALLLLIACGRLEPDSVPPTAIPDPMTLERSWLPHDALVCPPQACAARPDRPAPLLPHAPEVLFAAWKRVLATEPRTTIVALDPSRRLILAQQSSRLIGFIDTISIHVVAVGEGASFAAYSRS